MAGPLIRVLLIEDNRADARLIESAADIDAKALAGRTVVGLTAGASTPEELVIETIEALGALGYPNVREVTTAEENIVFQLPRELRS